MGCSRPYPWVILEEMDVKLMMMMMMMMMIMMMRGIKVYLQCSCWMMPGMGLLNDVALSSEYWIIIIIIITIYFDNVYFFHTKLGLDVFPIWCSSTYLWLMLIQTIPIVLLHKFSPCLPVPVLSPYISPLLPPHFYRQTHNHLHSYTPKLKPSQSAMFIHISHTLNT